MFGGKTTSYDDSFGGLYEIRLKDKLSIKLLDSNDQPNDSPFLKGRLGHVLHYLDTDLYPNTLAVVGGQRGKEYFKNISFYSLKTQTVYETVNFPIHTDGRVLQRSIIHGTDIIILFTYGKDKESKLDLIKLWSYSLIYKTWKEIKTNEGPLARTAHQFVYWKGSFYLFGGNVIDTRQNDFWKLILSKISREEVRRVAVMTVRKHKFLNLYDKNVERGLEYLRTKVRELVVDEYTGQIFEDACQEIFGKSSDEVDDISQYFI